MEVKLSPLDTSATNWPIVPAPDDSWMSVEQSPERKLASETKVLEENLPQCHLVHHKSHELTCDGTRAAAVGSRRLTA
jgi:hypothetical protein